MLWSGAQIGLTAEVSPLTIAETLADYIELNKELAGGHITLFEVARPGFINFTLGSAWFGEIISTIIRQGADYGKSNLGCGRRVLMRQSKMADYGPKTLTALHAEVFSESLSNLFAFCGFAVDCRDTLSGQALEHSYDAMIEIHLQEGQPVVRPSAEFSEVFTAEAVSSCAHGVDDLLQELGAFVLRFYLVQANCQAFQLDLDLARQCHLRNAAFAVQYAYARCAGLLRRAFEPAYNESGFEEPLIDAAQWSELELIGAWGRPESFSALFTAAVNMHEQYQKDLISMLEAFPDLVRQSLYSRQPGSIAHYTADLAGLLERFLASVNFYDDHLSVSKARLGLIFAVKQVLTNAGHNRFVSPRTNVIF